MKKSLKKHIFAKRAKNIKKVIKSSINKRGDNTFRKAKRILKKQEKKVKKDVKK